VTGSIPDSDRDFDVAISFLNEDVDTAVQLRDALAESLEVFIYTEKQEELAGTDGLESFRDVFRRRSRLVVILLRERWGKTPWTRVEMEAITDRFLQEGPDFLFVIVMEDCARPPWLPEKLIRFSLKDFGITQAVGAIKARALDRGSDFHKATTAFLAERAQKRAQFADNRTKLFHSEAGVRAAHEEAMRLIELIGEAAKEATDAASDLGIVFGADRDSAVMRVPSVSVGCAYRNHIINALVNARLFVTEFRGQVLLPGESGFYRVNPKELAASEFRPEITEELGWCWRGEDDEVRTSEEIARFFVERFFNLLDRQSDGSLPPLDW
jgi:hypothetical protein